MDDEAIAAVRTGLGALNRALSELPALGIEAQIETIDRTTINERAPRIHVTARLMRTKDRDRHSPVAASIRSPAGS